MGVRNPCDLFRASANGQEEGQRAERIGVGGHRAASPTEFRSAIAPCTRDEITYAALASGESEVHELDRVSVIGIDYHVVGADVTVMHALVLRVLSGVDVSERPGHTLQNPQYARDRAFWVVRNPLS
jgi:hypothetical protein